jgi:hypothetical protein
VIRGPTAGTIHGLTDDIPWAIRVLVPEGKRIKPRTAGLVIRSRGTRQPRNLEIGVERICIDGFHIRIGLMPEAPRAGIWLGLTYCRYGAGMLHPAWEHPWVNPESVEQGFAVSPLHRWMQGNPTR